MIFEKNLNESFFIAMIGGAAGAIITLIGTIFKPWLDFKWGKWRQDQKMKPRLARLQYILNPVYDKLGNVFYPSYELSILSNAVGLSNEDCLELLIKVGAWGLKENDRNVWSMTHGVFFKKEKNDIDFPTND